MNHHPAPSLRNRLAAAFTGLGLFLAVCATGHATLYTYSLDTSAYTGTAGYLAFDLIDGDATANNTLTVTGLSTDGLLSDASDFSLSDSSFFNEVLRDIVLGTTLSFSFELTENFAGGAPDMFGLYLLDGGTFFPLFGTSDPLLTDALMAVEIDGSAGGNVGVYAGNLRVPDHGSTLALCGLALGLLAFARQHGIRRSSV